MAVKFKRFVTMLLTFSLLCSSAYPEAASNPPEGREDDTTEHYQRGLELAKSECHCPGSLATGFVVGFSLPFVAGGGAALAYKCTNGCTPCGVVAALTMPILSIWGGHRLNKNYPVSMPAVYGQDMKETDRASFSSGYEAGKWLNRSKRYKLGITLGILTFVGTVFFIMYQLRDENFAPGV